MQLLTCACPSRGAGFLRELNALHSVEDVLSAGVGRYLDLAAPPTQSMRPRIYIFCDEKHQSNPGLYVTTLVHKVFSNNLGDVSFGPDSGDADADDREEGQM